ncbi:hypothetical protein COR50_18940 [Chitinophaga caeni]|uniref:Outer membrane protein beta-barrel domain-containing protein n=1 Tax=Chitinophaga caeni TaxID=2029983 RepID=A0A291QYH3_9BACT|nr:outer membrane beta-barrel protein [Chitinophaga caeni]ATL49079.1 hypothetical protein COR50_18940 [Chitinophaga caeni]
MKKILLTIVVLFFLNRATQAQTNPVSNLYGLSWEISIPTNNDFLDKTSFAGGRFEYRHFLSQAPVSFGVSLSWNSYEQYIPTQTITYKDGNAAITTDMDRIIYTVPILATAHYYFNNNSAVTPYAGVGVGAQYSEQDIYYNIFVTDEYNWGFAVRPEIGVLIHPKSNNWGFLLSANYNFATNKNSLFDINNLKSFSFNIGLYIGQ